MSAVHRPTFYVVGPLLFCTGIVFTIFHFYFFFCSAYLYPCKSLVLLLNYELWTMNYTVRQKKRNRFSFACVFFNT